MGVTRSTASDRRRRGGLAALQLGVFDRDHLSLAIAALTVAIGLLLASLAKLAPLDGVRRELEAGRLLDLNEVERPDEIEPFLRAAFESPADRRFVAREIHRHLLPGGHRQRLPNVGALARITVDARSVLKARGLGALGERVAAAAAARSDRPSTGGPDFSVPLVTTADVTAIKPSLVVRRPRDVTRLLLAALLAYFAMFWLADVALRWRRPAGDGLLLPIAHLITGFGLMVMVSLRDPVRDMTIFVPFVQGVVVGLVAMVAAARVDYQASALRRLSLVPLVGSVALSGALILFGSGPGSSDARVNLAGVQPVEAIRLLLVLFLAGYFADRWEFIRQLDEPPFARSHLLRRVRIPRLDHVAPVVAGVTVALALFFLQKDLGPALVFSCLFLVLYGVCRRAAPLVLVGLLLVVTGFWGGYLVGYPRTVAQRIAIWLSPWDNVAPGGDQVAQALWAFASGGATGTGLGLGAPGVVPAVHTDLVLAAAAEELGFAGIAAVLVLFALLVWRGLAIARRAPGDYTFFLSLGLTVGMALQVLLIGSGMLGLLPLSGVVTPFMSYGRSAMIANFAALGMLWSIASARPVSGGLPPGTVLRTSQLGTEPAVFAPFAAPVRSLGIALAAAGLVLGLRAAFIQVYRGDVTLAAPSLAVQADGAYRFQENPRLRQAAALLVRGTIRDRRGVPLASSRRAEVERHRAAYGRLGVSLDAACPRPEERCYPFGGTTFHLLGDARSRLNWGATNTSYVERDENDRLSGFDDHSVVVPRRDPRTNRTVSLVRRNLVELVPLWRYRHRPGHPAVQRLLSRNRDVTLTIDVRLQMALARVLAERLRQTGHERGAIVVMDAATGALLSSISRPWPSGDAGERPHSVEHPGERGPPELLDRARYGVYPPGSTFKIVTAAAALSSNAALRHDRFECRRLPDGRVGTTIHGWGRPIRDDEIDATPHGMVDMERGFVISCNAYFAQLGTRTGAAALKATAGRLEIPTGRPDSLERVRATLPVAAYGQGEVLVTPFKMARAVAAVASRGRMPIGHWVSGDRSRPGSIEVMPAAVATTIGGFMRNAVLYGTGRAVAGVVPAIAGKTGTAEVQAGRSHAWFAGYAPHGAAADGRRIAFAILVEHGGYGGRVAAPLARDIVTAAREVGTIK
jgi:cell division protein FtsW (lipid II flippase)